MRRRAASPAIPTVAIVASLVIGVSAIGGWFVVNSTSATKSPAAATVTSVTTLTPVTNETQAPTSGNGNGTATVTLVETVTTTVVSTFTVTLSTATVTVTSTVTKSATTTQQTQPPTVVTATFPASDFSTSPGETQFVCATGAGAQSGAWLEVATSNGPSLTLTGLSITWRAQVNQFTPAGPCYAQGYFYVDLPAAASLGSAAVTGQPFVVTLAFNDGTVFSFNADWQ